MKFIMPRRTALVLALASAALALPTQAAIITFDNVITGQTSYGFDGDADGINDVTFSTTDSGGFNVVGPGANQTWIREPGLEGTSLLGVDLRVDFVKGAVGSLTFGYALNSSSSSPDWFANIKVYDAANNLIGSATQVGDYTITNPPNGLSSFPEGKLSVSFAGLARYATFDFTSQHGRYIIDDFAGTFGSTEPVPEPATWAMLGAGLAVLGFARRRRR